jgi:hypothetical protein
MCARSTGMPFGNFLKLESPPPPWCSST